MLYEGETVEDDGLPGRREQIDELLKPTWPGEVNVGNIATANVYALLEIADAITNLASEVEKLGWPRDPKP